jgi:hypothetical protein
MDFGQVQLWQPAGLAGCTEWLPHGIAVAAQQHRQEPSNITRANLLALDTEEALHHLLVSFHSVQITSSYSNTRQVAAPDALALQIVRTKGTCGVQASPEMIFRTQIPRQVECNVLKVDRNHCVDSVSRSIKTQESCWVVTLEPPCALAVMATPVSQLNQPPLDDVSARSSNVRAPAHPCGLAASLRDGRKEISRVQIYLEMGATVPSWLCPLS